MDDMANARSTGKGSRAAGAVALCLLATPAAAPAATVAAHQGDSRIVLTLGDATFDGLAPGADLAAYQEGGLIIAAPDSQYVEPPPPLVWGGVPPPPIITFDCILPNPPVFRPQGGVNALVSIARADGAAILALEMRANVFDSAHQAVYLWLRVMRRGIVRGDFNLDVPCGTRVGVRGVFDELRAGAYVNAATRNAHNPAAHNLLAIDDVAFGEPAGVARFYTDPATFAAAAAAGGDAPTASWAFAPHGLGPGGAVAINGIPALDRFTHDLDPDDPWTSSSGTDLWPADLDSVRFATNSDPQGALVPVGPNALAFFVAGSLPDVPAPALVDNFLSKSFAVLVNEPVDRCHTGLALELISIVGAPGEPALFNITAYDEQDIGAGTVSIPALSGQTMFLGVLRDGGHRLGRLDLWDQEGSAEGLVSVAPYRRPPSCQGDLDASGAVDFGDVLALLTAWGGAGGPADLDGDGTVGAGDLLMLLPLFGTCPAACWPVS